MPLIDYDVTVQTVGEILTDSFGRLRTSNPGFRFDSQLTYAVDADLWDTAASSGSSVTHDADNRWAVLTTATGGVHSAVLQSHYHAPYTPGRSQLYFVTGLFGAAPASGGVRRMGAFDGTSGVYLEQSASGVSVVLKGATDLGTQTVPQSAWNLDAMDGRGPSGLTLDLSKVQILVINYQALYVGRVLIGFDIDGKIVPVHQFVHANRVAYPYITQANLPVRYEASTTGPEVVMQAICASAVSEGGQDLADISGRTFGTAPGASVAVTTRRPVLAIRARETLNSIDQNALIVPQDLEMLARTNDGYIELIRNGALTKTASTPTWANVNEALSVAEVTTDADGITGGTRVWAGYITAAANNRTTMEKGLLGRLLLVYSHLTAAGDSLAVVATSRTGTCDLHAALNWKEIR